MVKCMKKYKTLISVIIFNLAETILIFLVGRLLCLPTNLILLVMVIFLLTRATIGKALHFCTWYRCLIWSLLILSTLFGVVKLELPQSILLSIYAGFLLTGRANIKDMYLWGGNDLNQRVFEWVKFNLNKNCDLLKYEEQLKEKDSRKYYIFVYRFREFKTYREISEIMGIAERRVTEELAIMSHYIEFGIRLK